MARLGRRQPFAPIIKPAVAGGVANTLNAEAGSYAITGAAATLPVNRPLNAAAGSYSITGAAATNSVNRPLNAASGSYSVSGQATTNPVNRPVNAAGGSYTVTGAAATLDATVTVEEVVRTPGYSVSRTRGPGTVDFGRYKQMVQREKVKLDYDRIVKELIVKDEWTDDELLMVGAAYYHHLL